jgi:uncharacterized membrane protein (DUF2068 family)
MDTVDAPPRATAANGLRVIALVEAGKGALVVLAGLGLLELLHHDAQNVAETIVRHFHLNPASHIPRIFLEAAAAATDSRLQLLALAAAGYALVRFVEAWGLWRGRTWAEWLGIISGSLYLPIEAFELIRTVNPFTVGTFLINLGIVAWLARCRWHSRRHNG